MNNTLHSKTSENKIKPDCKLLGKDGNIFNLMALATQTLKTHDKDDDAIEMRTRIESCGDYYKALVIIGEYVNII